MDVQNITTCAQCPRNYRALRTQIEKAEKKEKINKAIKTTALVTGLISAGAIAGFIIAKKTPNLQNKIKTVTQKFQKKIEPQTPTHKIQYKKPPIDIELPRRPIDNSIPTDCIVKNIGNGVTDTVTTKYTLAGTDIVHEMSKPINGVSRVHVVKSQNGSMDEIISYDIMGKVVKQVEKTRANGYHNPRVLEITDKNGKVTKIYREFSKKFDKIKAIVIEYPDNTYKRTPIPGNFKEGLKEVARSLNIFMG